MQRPRFEIAPCPSEDVARLRRELGVSRALAQVLVRRGLEDPARARAFLAADEEHHHAAFAGIGEAVQTILEHARAGRRITIHGDYDVDGVCSTAILVRALRAIGADVDSYLPVRASDGYGLGTATVRRLAARGTQLLVSVDCAITAVEEVELARELDLLDGRDRAVHADQQPRAPRRQSPHRRRAQAVAVAGTIGQIGVDVRADRPQRAHEDRRRAHAVDVVVAVNRDSPARAGVLEDRLHRLADAGGRRVVMLLVSRQEGACARGILKAPAHQHLRQRPADAELAPQARDVLAGARRYLKAWS